MGGLPNRPGRGSSGRCGHCRSRRAATASEIRAHVYEQRGVLERCDEVQQNERAITTRFCRPPRGNGDDVLAMFLFYATLAVAGVSVYVAIGLAHG